MRKAPIAVIVAASLLANQLGLAQGRRGGARPAKPAQAEAAAPAPPPPPPSLADTLNGDAKSDYMAGRLLYGDGDFGGALVKFRSAYDKSKNVRLLWNIAACEKSLRHYANVLRLLRQYQTDGAAVLAQSDKDEASELLKNIEPFTAALTVTVSEPSAEILVDGEHVGESPLEKPVTVDIGMRTVLVRKEGFKEVSKEVPVGGSPTLSVSVSLEKIVHQGRLAVTAGDKDAIAIDGKMVAAGSFNGILASGGHMIRVTAPDMRPYQSEVVIADNETRTLSITLEKESRPSAGIPPWAWIGGGILLAGGIAAGSYAIFKPADKTAPLPEGTLQPGNVQASYPAFRLR